LSRFVSTRNLLAAGVLVLGALGPAAYAGAHPANAPATKHIAVILATLGVSAYQEMAGGAKFAAADLGGIDLKVFGPAQADGQQELKLFQSAASTYKDGIVFNTLSGPLFAKPLAQAIAKGVPVVTMNSLPPAGSNVTLYVGNDNYDLGASLAQETIKRLPKNASGTVVVNDGGKGTPVFDNRVQAIRDAFAKALPAVKIVESAALCVVAAPCYKAMAPVVHANTNALAILAVRDVDTSTLAQLKMEVGGKFLAAGIDVNPVTLKAVKSGVLFCTISPEQYLKGYIATRLLAEAVKTGKPMLKGWFDEPGLVVDQSHADVFIARQSSDAAMRASLRPEIAKIFANVASFMKPLSNAR
jgi:ABC-type sugar transport system substrate-binding protein